MAPLPRLGLFAADVALTAIAAWLVVCASGIRERGVLEVSMAWCLAMAALIAGAGVILGITGGLGATGFLAIHTLALCALAIGRRRSLAADFSALSNAVESARKSFDARSFESIAVMCMLIVLTVLVALAAWAEPATADALTYHLPRIAQWLQDGRVHELASQDARMNFVAAVPDLVMAWLIGGTAVGFRPADLAQAAGGVMAFGATIGLARQTGLGRGAALMAGALLFGMANVMVQFTSAQTDLFTTGVFAAAFYLWLCALKRGMGSDLGGAGAGLALGAKGTMFYLAPGALVWVAYLAWRNPMPWARWRCTAIAAALGIVLFAVPGFVQNWRLYGDPLGPKEWVSKLHQGATSPSAYLQKLQWNLTSSLAQVFEPQSQPHGLRAAGRAVVGALVPHVPEKDPFTLGGLGRKTTLQNAFMGRTEPDADVVSFGIVTFLLLVAGSLVALARSRREDGRLVMVWSAGIAVFLLFFHAMQQWHPFAFRYFVLVAPWIAVVSAWGIEQLRGILRPVAWAIVLAATVDAGWNVTTRTHQAGWRAVVQPERSRNYFVSKNWGEWSRQLKPGFAPLSLCLPEERPVAGFYRQSPQRRISFKSEPGDAAQTAEDLARGDPGWVIVPATRFLGREGHVAACVWLYKGDDESPFSIAAYRQLQAGERPRPMLYRDVRIEEQNGLMRELLVKTWDAEPIRFRLSNPRTSVLAYEMLTPLANMKGEMPAASIRAIEVVLPADSVSEVRFLFGTPGADKLPLAEPTVELMP